MPVSQMCVLCARETNRGRRLAYTPVHFIVAVGNCGLCMRWYLACSRYMHVMHCALVIDTSAKAALNDAQLQATVSSTLMHRL